jgi:hypothetical protein
MDTDELTAYLDRLEDAGVERLVVRWIDESRPILHGESGVEVAHVKRATFTAKVDGEAEQTEIEGVPYDELKRVVDTYPFEVLYRSDNVAR